MKLKFDSAKVSEMVSNIQQKTSDASKKAVEELQKSATAISEKAKQDSYQRRMKKYNPLFPDVYNSANFNLPNMIMIVDDVDRRDIDVCEGSIGWLGTENGVEVLYLYDDAVKMSGLQFIPSAACGSVYYLDSFVRNRFIRLDCIFSKAHDERLAELKSIAHSLGAKSCSIEISESIQEVSSASMKSGLSGTIGNLKMSSSMKREQVSSYHDSAVRSGKITAEFEGNSEPHRPKLKWFSHDDTIKKLIDMRCGNSNSLKSETLELAGASSATMTQKTASTIDGAISKMGLKFNSSMEAKAVTENTSKLIFHIEF